MDTFRVFSFYLCFWIVHTAIIEDVVIRRPNEKCGTVTIKGPIVSGRDVKVEFLPTHIQSGFSASINCRQLTPEFTNMTTNGSIYTHTLKRITNVNIRYCLVRYSVNQQWICDTDYFEEQKLLKHPILTEPTTATFSDCGKCPEESSTTAVGNDRHGTLIGAVVPVLAVAVIMIVIACVYWKRKKRRHEQNAVNVHRNDDEPTQPDQNNDGPGDAGDIIQWTTNPENEYACVIPKSQRPQRQQEEKIPLAAENDCEYAVVNKERKGRTNSSVQAHLAESKPELNYAELEIQTPPDDHQSQHATVSSETGATEYTSIDFPRTYNNA